MAQMRVALLLACAPLAAPSSLRSLPMAKRSDLVAGPVPSDLVASPGQSDHVAVLGMRRRRVDNLKLPPSL